MSDFLLNLARRSAGLAPTVRARATPPAGADDRLERDGDSGAARETAAMPMLASADSPPSPRVIGAPSSATPAAPHAPLVQVVGGAPSHTAQRAAASAVLPASPAPTAVAAASTSPVVRDVPAKREAVPNDPVRAEPTTNPVVPRASDVTVPVVMKIEPAALPAATSAAPPVAAAPDRTVHVRIGAIEIYGGDGGSRTREAMPPAASPVNTTGAGSAPLAGGFDDFAALRSYTPWSW